MTSVMLNNADRMRLASTSRRTESRLACVHARVDDLAAPRRAFTLIELLVVIFIILAVTAVTVPTIVPAIQSRQVREAARQLNVFIAAARNRAMETGRPYGVMIERYNAVGPSTTNMIDDDGDGMTDEAGEIMQVSQPEMSMTISYAETPEAYTGGYNTSRAVVSTYFDMMSSSTIYYVSAIWSTSTPGTMPVGGDDTSWDGVVRPGDMIRFDNKGTWYRLAIINQAMGMNNSQLYAGGDTYGRQGRFSANGNKPPNWRIEVPPGAPTPRAGAPVIFEVMRSPVKAAGGSLQLPEGVVIDLNSSGDSYLSFYPRADKLPPNLTQYSYYGTGTPIALTSGMNSMLVTSFEGRSGLSNSDPVIIMFSPNGTVGQVYTRRYRVDTLDMGNTGWTWYGDFALYPIYLLVGHREKIPFSTSVNYNYTGSNRIDDQAANNWRDTTCMWVKIEPKSGMVLVAENLPASTDPNNLQINQPWSNTLNPGGLDDARRAAREGRPAGGR